MAPGELCLHAARRRLREPAQNGVVVAQKGRNPARAKFEPFAGRELRDLEPRGGYERWFGRDFETERVEGLVALVRDRDGMEWCAAALEHRGVNTFVNTEFECGTRHGGFLSRRHRKIELVDLRSFVLGRTLRTGARSDDVQRRERRRSAFEGAQMHIDLLEE